MGIKISYHGAEITVNSPHEAAEIVRLLTAPPRGALASVMGDIFNAPTSYLPSPDVDVERFTEFLIANVGQVLTGDMLAKGMGLKGKEGVGPLMRAMKRKLAERSLDLFKIVERNQRGQGPVTWTVLDSAELGKLVDMRTT